jgi:hypothetical protein
MLSIAASTTAYGAGFATPEEAVLALEQAYMQKDADRAVAVMDFVEEGRQMLQRSNPIFANDPDTIRQAAEGREQAFRDDLRTNGFPDFSQLKCSFVGTRKIAPELLELTQQCQSPDGAKSLKEVLVKKSEPGWRVTLVPPP